MTNSQTFLYLVSLINTRYRMDSEIKTAEKKTALAVKADKLSRLKKVRRKVADVEDRDLSDVGLLDEILEEGLTQREKKLGI